MQTGRIRKPLLTIKNPERLVWLGLGLWWIVNLLQAGFTELADDEAYYHMFAQHLAWGYFDHPPMVALLVWLGGFLGGEIGVRFFFTLLQPLYLFALWRIIRPQAPTLRDAKLFVLLCAAMPILQLYGFIAVPDGPLMLFTALLLWCYKRFTESDRWREALLMGLCLAALAYSKYHGALVWLLIMASNPKLLKNRKFWGACLLAAVLIVPHLWWQYRHDWVSLSYHLTGRNRDFELGFVSEYLLNLFAIFNPFLFPVFIAAWWKSRAATPIERALSWIAAGFILFFLASTFRGYVQPQWDIPATFGVIALLFGYVRGREKLHRYALRVCWITIGLVALTRIEMLCNPLGIKFQIFNNHATNNELAEIAAGRPINFAGRYTAAAKYHFYTGEVGYARPTVLFRTSQYQFSDADSLMAGGPVVVEVAPETPGVRNVTLADGKTFNYIVVDPFIPVRKIEIETADIPQSLTPGDSLRLHLNVHNPYPYTYNIDGKGAAISLVWRRVGEPTLIVPLSGATGLLDAGGTLSLDAQTVVPELKTGKRYLAGLILTNSPVVGWFNGKPVEVTITPKP